MPRLLVLFTDKQIKALQRMKSQDGVPMGEFIRRAVEKALAERSQAPHPAPQTR